MTADSFAEIDTALRVAGRRTNRRSRSRRSDRARRARLELAVDGGLRRGDRV